MTASNRVENPVFSSAQQTTVAYGSFWNHIANMSFGINYWITPHISLLAQTEITRFTYEQNYQTLTLLTPNPSFVFGLTYLLSTQKQKDNRINEK